MLRRRIRVLIVDDSAIVRKCVSDALATDPEIEVVGTAVDPFIARDKINDLNPDVVTLDLEMPRMDGLTFLKIVMQQRPMPIIIMSSLTQKGSETALEALRLGAFDVLAKPHGAYSFGDLGPQLIARIKAARGARLFRGRADGALAAVADTQETSPTVPPTASGAASQPVPVAAASSSPTPVTSMRLATARDVAAMRPPALSFGARDLIVIGASTGGTEALREILARLPPRLPPIAIVQHIPPVFSRAFADRLNTICQIRVREAVDGERLEAGVALIAPGGLHMLLHWQGDHYCTRLASGPPVWHQRPAVDLLFKSAADAAPAGHVLAGVLTGMGRDGADGLMVLRQRGATTFAQDETTSVVYGMPKVAWECGAAQRQLPLDQMAAHIVSHYSAPARR